MALEGTRNHPNRTVVHRRVHRTGLDQDGHLSSSVVMVDCELRLPTF